LRGAAKAVNHLSCGCNRNARWLAFGDAHDVRTLVQQSLYEQIVAAARQPVFYSQWNVPDTPLGRFEMLSLMMVLVQQRLNGGTGDVAEVAQLLIDKLFSDLDHSLRELGVGDLSVPKRIKKLARMFYGRAAAYDDALAKGDAEAMAAALCRNVRPGEGDWPGAAQLAAYASRAMDALSTQDTARIAEGVVSFPAAEAAAPAS
jgi:cytochrome b pre-mRNA-processing protein 3